MKISAIIIIIKFLLVFSAILHIIMSMSGVDFWWCFHLSSGMNNSYEIAFHRYSPLHIKLFLYDGKTIKCSSEGEMRWKTKQLSVVWIVCTFKKTKEISIETGMFANNVESSTMLAIIFCSSAWEKWVRSLERSWEYFQCRSGKGDVGIWEGSRIQECCTSMWQAWVL